MEPHRDSESSVPQLDEYVPLLPTKKLGVTVAVPESLPRVPTANIAAPTTATAENNMAVLLDEILTEPPVVTAKPTSKPAKKSAQVQPSLFDNLLIDVVDFSVDLPAAVAEPELAEQPLQQAAPQIAKTVTPQAMAPAHKLPVMGFVAPAFERVVIADAMMADAGVAAAPVVALPVVTAEEPYDQLRAGLLGALREVIGTMAATTPFAPPAEPEIVAKPVLSLSVTAPPTNKTAEDYLPFGHATFRMACM